MLYCANQSLRSSEVSFQLVIFMSCCLQVGRKLKVKERFDANNPS